MDSFASSRLNVRRCRAIFNCFDCGTARLCEASKASSRYDNIDGQRLCLGEWTTGFAYDVLIQLHLGVGNDGRRQSA